MKINNYVLGLLTIIMLNVLGYILVSFILLTFDITEWSKNARSLYAFFIFLTIMPVSVATVATRSMYKEDMK